MAHAIDLRMQIVTPFGRKPVTAFVARGVVVLETLNPSLRQKPLQRAVKRSGAEHNPATAHVLDVFED